MTRYSIDTIQSSRVLSTTASFRLSAYSRDADNTSEAAHTHTHQVVVDPRVTQAPKKYQQYQRWLATYRLFAMQGSPIALFLSSTRLV